MWQSHAGCCIDSFWWSALSSDCSLFLIRFILCRLWRFLGYLPFLLAYPFPPTCDARDIIPYFGLFSVQFPFFSCVICFFPSLVCACYSCRIQYAGLPFVYKVSSILLYRICDVLSLSRSSCPRSLYLSRLKKQHGHWRC